MRKVILRMNEEHKYKIIKRLVDNNGNKKRAAIELNCTIRTIDRLINVYKIKGKSGFIHGNRDRKPIFALSNEEKDKILLIFENKYFDANWKHALELMKSNDNINISYYTFHNLLMDNGFISPRCNKATKKKVAAILKSKAINKSKL